MAEQVFDVSKIDFENVERKKVLESNPQVKNNIPDMDIPLIKTEGYVVRPKFEDKKVSTAPYAWDDPEEIIGFSELLDSMLGRNNGGQETDSEETDSDETDSEETEQLECSGTNCNETTNDYRDMDAINQTTTVLFQKKQTTTANDLPDASSLCVPFSESRIDDK